MAKRSRAGKPVVLLVEDEPLVRVLNLEIMDEAGYRVLDASDADEAFEILRRRDDICCILTDVHMPGSMDGFEFARLVAQGWPHVPVVIVSGKATPKAGDLPPGATFIRKPYWPAALVETLREVIAHPVAPSVAK